MENEIDLNEILVSRHEDSFSDSLLRRCTKGVFCFVFICVPASARQFVQARSANFTLGGSGENFDIFQILQYHPAQLLNRDHKTIHM